MQKTDNEERPSQPKLDLGKLLGFRNLAAVAELEGDFSEGSEQLFNKKGAETPSDRLYE